ncbi:MAG: hypothetical protein JWL94_1919 [Microbacteriaceae bacterium]|jgi:GntR family transcriptional regulator|nr:hypothetical protein [Microbacteriaceae bacterium]
MKTRKPIYAAIYHSIVEGIRSGEYSVGLLLPSESDLEQRFNASRTPVRQALSELENDGYIYRVQGKGSFVSDRNPVGAWARTTGFQHHYLQATGRIWAKTVSVENVVREDYARLLALPESTLLTLVHRVRFIDDEPVIFYRHYVSPQIDATIFEGDFSSKDALLWDRQGIRVAEIEESIVAVAARDDVASRLAVDVGAPVLKLVRLSIAYGQGAVDVTEYHVRSDRWDYIAHYRTE